MVTVTTRQVSSWHLTSALWRASPMVRKSGPSPNAPHERVASAPAARAVLTATSISVAVASRSVPATVARMIGKKRAAIALPLPRHGLATATLMLVAVNTARAAGALAT